MGHLTKVLGKSLEYPFVYYFYDEAAEDWTVDD